MNTYETLVFDNGTLILNSVQGSDSGRYECVAVNEVGNVSIYIDVTVHGKDTSIIKPVSS